MSADRRIQALIRDGIELEDVISLVQKLGRKSLRRVVSGLAISLPDEDLSALFGEVKEELGRRKRARGPKVHYRVTGRPRWHSKARCGATTWGAQVSVSFAASEVTCRSCRKLEGMDEEDDA